MASQTLKGGIRRVQSLDLSLTGTALISAINQRFQGILMGPTSSGALTPGDVWVIDANGNMVDGGPLSSTSTGGAIGGVNKRTGSYTAVPADDGMLVTFQIAAPSTFKLPALSPGTAWKVFVQNTGPATLTLSPNGRQIDGAAGGLVLYQNFGCVVFSDGSNYFTERGMLAEAPIVTVNGASPASAYEVNGANMADTLQINGV